MEQLEDIEIVLLADIAYFWAHGPFGYLENCNFVKISLNGQIECDFWEHFYSYRAKDDFLNQLAAIEAREEEKQKRFEDQQKTESEASQFRSRQDQNIIRRPTERKTRPPARTSPGNSIVIIKHKT